MSISVSPSATIGTDVYAVTVTNPNGDTSSPFNLSVQAGAPTITSVTNAGGSDACSASLSQITSKNYVNCDVNGTNFLGTVSLVIAPSNQNGSSCGLVDTSTNNYPLPPLVVVNPQEISFFFRLESGCSKPQKYFDVTVNASGGSATQTKAIKVGD